MSLIVLKGVIQYEPGLDLIERYAEVHRTKILYIKMWGFERLPYGHIAVAWKNGAFGTHTGPKLSEMMDRVESHQGWPKPTLFHGALPYGAGYLYKDEFELAAQQQPEKSEEDYAIQRVVRRRHVGNIPVARQRRVRAET